MNIEVFLSESCIYCIMLREWLDENQIAYIEKNIVSDSEALGEFRKLQGRATPFTVFKNISGEIVETVTGFNEQKIKSILDNNKESE